ncbi:MAG TPA: cell division protein FtsZ [Blastocatellia bacterium]|nr:cell division protein FtsZ [Blastocatellia bacterium]
MHNERQVSGQCSIAFAESEPPDEVARIKVVGVGGAGGNAVNRMIEDGMTGVEFIVCNTDLQALRSSRAPVKIQLGADIARGLGAGGDPEVGKQAALADVDRLFDALDGANMVFVAAGLGGGTGTGAAPIVASIASELGALTVGVVTRPFAFEGLRRMRNAEAGLEEFRGCIDSVVTVPNERLLGSAVKGVSFVEAFRMADEVLRQAVRGISDIIMLPGLINVDFADVRTTMMGRGVALMGTGIATGNNRALEAVQRAISSPLLEEASIEGAKSLLVNLTGSPDVELGEVNEAMMMIHDAADCEASIIFGAVIDESLTDELRITVIATDFASTAASSQPAPPIRGPQGPGPGHRPTSTNDNDLAVPAFMRKSAN